MSSDLFGRPTYDSARTVQPELYPAEHWFRLGYLDSWHGEARPGASPAYRAGVEAAARDRGDNRACDPCRAFRQARACGNVREG